MELFILLACVNSMFTWIVVNQLNANSKSLREDWKATPKPILMGIIVGMFFLWWAVVACGKDFHE